jgi:hypothetical protein
MRRSKLILVDGLPRRMRRGKLVVIPWEWLGKTVSKQKIAARPSKAIHKHRKMLKYGKRKKEVFDGDRDV